MIGVVNYSLWCLVVNVIFERSSKFLFKYYVPSSLHQTKNVNWSLSWIDETVQIEVRWSFIVEAAHHYRDDDHKEPNNQSMFPTRMISSSRLTVGSGKPIKLLSHAPEKRLLFLLFLFYHTMQMFIYLDDNILWVNKVDMNVTGITAFMHNAQRNKNWK